MTAQGQIQQKLIAVPNSMLVKMARELQNILTDEADLVMGCVLAELESRYDEAEFLAICEDLDGRLAMQTGLADPMHY